MSDAIIYQELNQIRRIRGKITDETQDSIKIKRDDGKEFRIFKSIILKIEYGGD